MERAYIVVGLGFGDEGKGSVVDALCERVHASLVVRFNGGSQAAHNVVLPDGTHHCFSQIGSGAFRGARTHLSSYMVFDPLTFRNECRELQQLGVRPQVSIDPSTKVITPLHVKMNHWREGRRGDLRHGSCGMGVGETVHAAMLYPELAITIGDLLQHEERAVEKFYTLRDVLSRENHDLHASFTDWYERARTVEVQLLRDDEALADAKTVVFEGAQGVLLDEVYGFHPHTTWSFCTTFNAERLIRDQSVEPGVTRIGVTRTYSTRHGHGPFPTAALFCGNPGEHNKQNEFQGAFRTGPLDLVLLNYALSVAGVQTLAITHCDERVVNVCTSYDWSFVDSQYATLTPGSLERQERMGIALDRVHPVCIPVGSRFAPALIAEMVNYPVFVQSFGPTAEHKIFTPDAP